MSIVEDVERVLDVYVQLMRERGVSHVYGFQAHTLAALAGVQRDVMSRWLQDHRRVQERGMTRYVLGCEGYGPSARWHITSMPLRDPKRVQAARVDHSQYLTADNVRKYLRDVAREIDPALKRAEHDPRIRDVLKLATEQLAAVAKFVRTALGRGDGQGGVSA